MWLLYAFGSAFFAGMTAVLAKVGVKSTDADLVTALRTAVVVLFSWLMTLLAGTAASLVYISPISLLFLILSGLATGASWICYYRALKDGDVNKITPIDKSSTVLTMILAFVILDEKLSPAKIAGMLLISAGTLLMITKTGGEPKEGRRRWMIYAAGSAVFAALTAILGKIGLRGVESNLAVAVRTVIVLLFAWGIVIGRRKTGEIKNVDSRSWVFIILSGLATGASWLCYFRAIQFGEVSVVAPIDKLSVLITILFSRIFLKEKLRPRALTGLFLLTGGTLALLLT